MKNQKHKIDWLNIPGYKGETWNPVVGCEKISEGCENCYAEKMAIRQTAMGTMKYIGTIKDKKWTGHIGVDYTELDKPLQWRKPRVIFVCSMGDLFHKDVELAIINMVLNRIEVAPQHLYIILTKRPERMKEVISALPETLPNLWLGVTAENQQSANERIPILLDTPAAKRLVSIEPMLGAIDFDLGCIEEGFHHALDGQTFCPGMNEPIRSKKLDWVIVGGENGHKARPMHPLWAIKALEQCKKAGTPFFFKGWGEWNDITHGYEYINSKPPNSFPIHTFGSGYTSLDVYKVGKKNSGNLLNGKFYHEFPIQKENIKRTY
jgi:protein gp37